MKSLPFAALLFSISLLLAACKPNVDEQKTDGQNARVKLPTAFYKQFKGTLGGQAITMDLEKQDSIFSGQYYYDTEGILHEFIGTMDSIGNVALYASTHDGDPSSILQMHFLSSSSIEGIIGAVVGEREQKFNLQENTEGILSFNYERTLTSRGQTAPPNEDLGRPSTVESYLHIRKLRIKAPNPALAKIDSAIVAAICSIREPVSPHYDSIFSNFRREAYESLLELDYYSSVVINTKGVLCLSVSYSEYTGGAHPFGLRRFLNFDARTGQAIRLEDLLLPGSKPKLDRIGEGIFKGTDQLGYPEDEESSFALPNNFAITPAGLLFEFDFYEIAPYAAGRPQVLVPFTEIEDLLSPLPLGVASEFRKQTGSGEK